MEQNMGLQILSLNSLYLSKVCISILNGCCFSDQLKPKELSSKVLSWLKSFKTNNGEVFGVLFLFCSLHLKVQRLILQTLQVIFINIAKSEASSCVLFRKYVAKSQYVDELWCGIHFSKTNYVYVFGNYSKILIYGSELLFSGLLKNGKHFKTL